jgi:hypothetical protein
MKLYYNRGMKILHSKNFIWLVPVFFLPMILVLGRCGVPVCVAGFGQCGNPPGLTVSTTTNSGSLTISPTSPTVKVNASQSFTASGGNGTYNWTIQNNSSLTYGHWSNGTATITGNSVTFVGPASLPSVTNVTISVSDTSSTPLNGSTSLTLSN